MTLRGWTEKVERLTVKISESVCVLNIEHVSSTEACLVPVESDQLEFEAIKAHNTNSTYTEWFLTLLNAKSFVFALVPKPDMSKMLRSGEKMKMGRNSG